MDTVKRVILIVMDSLGVGALPDSYGYFNDGKNDSNSDTLGHILEKAGELKIPNLKKMGLLKVHDFYGKRDACSDSEKIIGAYGRMKEQSKGKDTITGHWEIAGLYTEIPFKTYPDGFPAEFISLLEEKTGRRMIGNYAASGTVIIEDLGDEHERTGSPIVYTSADSVFQIAANTDVIPLDELYKICETARALLVGEWACGRVIARPYVKKDGKRTRTSDRKDYAVSPPQATLLNNITDAGKTVYAVGKISDIFNASGVTESVHTDNNMDGCNKTIDAVKRDFEGLIFTNLVDFDSKFGHRRDIKGYGQAIEEFDARLPEIMSAMKKEDVLILCADHGNDPSYPGWDHTREYVPVLVFGEFVSSDINLGDGDSFANIGATVADLLDVKETAHGKSFADKILKKHALGL